MPEKVKFLIRYIIGFPKTIYVNLRLLPFSQAIKLPIIVSHKTCLQSLSGKVILEHPKFAILKIGFGLTPVSDFSKHRSIINLKGELKVNGKCRFGAGSKIHVFGKLELGRGFNMSGMSTIVCNKQITFRERSLISWDVLIMDTDQHSIKNKEGQIINEDKAIFIGPNVWLCSGVKVLKGVNVSGNVIIAANTVLTGNYENKNVILAGTPPKPVKEYDSWK